MPIGAIGAIGGGLLSAAGARKAAKSQDRATAAAAEAAKFRPYDITSGFGQALFDEENQTARGVLDPRYQALANTLFGMSNDYFGQQNTMPPELANLGALGTNASAGYLGQLTDFNPYDAARTHFNMLDAILQPGRDRTRDDLEATLLAQGRLGSTGGGITQGELERQIEAQRTQMLYDAFGQAQDVQSNLANLGTNLGKFGLGIDEYGLGRDAGLFNRGISALNANLGLEQLPMTLLDQGGVFGGRQASAGAAMSSALLNSSKAQGGYQGALLSSLGNTISGGFGNLGGLFGGGGFGGGGASPYEADLMSRYGSTMGIR